jgi:2-polyprenyl-6-methoxyphenol hydroxylase-like FAD-dependent oxidoreductase
MEVWASRGIAQRFLDEGRRVPHSHYGLLDKRMDYGVLDTPFPFILMLGQRRVEELLEAHARDLGVDIKRGHAVTAVHQRSDSVSVRVSGPEGEYDLAGDYVVGCDGVGSTVRQAAGIDFEGTASSAIGWFADVRLDAPPKVPYYQRYSPDGALIVVPMEAGIYRIAAVDPGDGRPDDWGGTYTVGELAGKLRVMTGEDFEPSDLTWFSRTGTAVELAARYRARRVFLAGDAAHRIFPAGGVGLNVGLQDAHNLGWKLAAVLNGSAPDRLLDSYHDERRAVGAALLGSTRAQVALMTRFDPETIALRAALSTAIAEVPEFSRRLAGEASAIDTYYPPRSPDAHALVGTRAPNLRFADGTDLFTLLEPAKHVLLDLAVGAPAGSRPAWAGVRSALIRPDGHVAWASDDAGDEVPRSAAESYGFRAASRFTGV